jgi:hypothetical protein
MEVRVLEMYRAQLILQLLSGQAFTPQHENYTLELVNEWWTAYQEW